MGNIIGWLRVLCFASCFTPGLGAVSLLVSGGALRDENGSVLPNGAVVVLVASTADEFVPTVGAGTELTVGRFISVDDVILAVWQVDQTISGVAGGFVGTVILGDSGGAIQSIVDDGSKLAILWFPAGSVVEGQVLPRHAYGSFRTADLSKASDIPWVVPDSASGGLALSTLDTDLSGEVAIAALSASSESSNTAVAPQFVYQPQSQMVRTGTATELFAGAWGTGAFTFQWYRDGQPLEGEGSAVLRLLDVELEDVGNYHVEVTSSWGQASSHSATLGVIQGNGTSSNEAPLIATQPKDAAVSEGNPISFVVQVSGSVPLTYQWRKNGIEIAGANEAEFSIGSVAAINVGAYSVVIENEAGRVVSQPARLELVGQGVPPDLASLPSTEAAFKGSLVTLSVTATGSGPLSYQWFRDGAPVYGAIGPTLGLLGLALEDQGNYTVKVSNAYGTVTSNPVALLVLSDATTESRQQVEAPGYAPGGEVIVENVVAWKGIPDGLVWTADLPVGWSFIEDLGSGADEAPKTGDSGSIMWRWNQLPAADFGFSYRVMTTHQQHGTVSIGGRLQAYFDASDLALEVAPNPLVIAEATGGVHTADLNADFSLSYEELMRVWELFDTIRGTERTGRYRPSQLTVDGFEPDSETSLETELALSRYHSADTNQDGRISVTEMTRVVELYNNQSETGLRGGYDYDESSEDGFIPRHPVAP